MWLVVQVLEDGVASPPSEKETSIRQAPPAPQNKKRTIEANRSERNNLYFVHGYARVLDPENRKDAAGRKKPKKQRGKKEEKGTNQTQETSKKDNPAT